MLMLLSVFMFIVTGCTPKGTQSQSPSPGSTAQVQEKPKIQNIGIEQFKQLMGKEDAVVLDVRTPREIAAGKIEGALEIDVNGDQFDTKIQELDKEKTY